MKVLVLLATVALASGQHTKQYTVVKKVLDFRTPAPQCQDIEDIQTTFTP
jgi:hypothetical protein